MVVFDYDGVLIKNKKIELIGRKLLKKIGFKNPPAIFFTIGGLITSLSISKSVISEEVKKILGKYHAEKIYTGILTDQNLFSIVKNLKKNNFSFADFDFIQAKKSFLNRFSGINSLVGRLKSTWLAVTNKTKPHPDVFKELAQFAKEKRIKNEEILMIDDIDEIRSAARKFGFSVAESIRQSIFIINPDLS